MTRAELKTISTVIVPFIESGLISGTVLEELKQLVSVGEREDIPQEPLMTRRDACKLLRVSAQSIRNYETSGLIRPLRVAGGKLVRYRRSDVEGLLKGAMPKEG